MNVLRSILLVSIFLFGGCSYKSHEFKNFPESDLIEAFFDARRISIELDLKMSVCRYYGTAHMTNNMEAQQFIRELDFSQHYQNNKLQDFNRAVKKYGNEYNQQYKDTVVEFIEQLNQAILKTTFLPARFDTASYFGVGNQEVKQALSNENFSGYYQYSPYAGVIVNALEKKDKSIEGKCGKFFKDVLDDKYMPNFSRYGDEYKKMTGYDDLR